jgi:hypothetical protein
MHVPVLDVRILRNETFYPYESHAMKSLDMVVVKSHVNRGPIMLRMKWPDGGYTRIPTVVGSLLAKYPHSLIIQASQSSITTMPHRKAGNDPSILDLVTQEKLVALSQRHLDSYSSSYY